MSLNNMLGYKNRVLSATLEFTCNSVRARDVSAVQEGIRTFNALGLPWVFMGVNDREVHVTFVGGRYTQPGMHHSKSLSLVYLADVVWELGFDGQYDVIKDRTGLYKGPYRV